MRTVAAARPTNDIAIYRLVSMRVAPPLILLYVVAFLDRVNVGFASLSMNHDLGISDSMYGFAAGIFFLGYLLFAVPSNYALARVGARRWIAVLMITWGLVSGGLAFVHGPGMYFVLRFLLGAAEAGFFPGIVYYLTGWLPGSARAGIMALFYFAIPLSSVIGSPVSAALMRLNGWHGLAGWQWLFLLEALPAVALGCAVPWLLYGGVDEVRWLAPEQKNHLLATIRAEAVGNVEGAVGERLPEAKHSAEYSDVLPFAAAYFTLMVGLYELGFWTPRLLTTHGISMNALGWVNAIPYALGGVGMLLWSRWSDVRRERRWTLFASFCLAMFGFASTACTHSAPVAVMTLSLAAFGVLASMAVFWAAYSQRLTTQAAATGIAAVNSVGNVGGFLGPYATGWLLNRTHSYQAGLLVCAAGLMVGAGIIQAALRERTHLR